MEASKTEAVSLALLHLTPQTKDLVLPQHVHDGPHPGNMLFLIASPRADPGVMFASRS